MDALCFMEASVLSRKEIVLWFSSGGLLVLAALSPTAASVFFPDLIKIVAPVSAVLILLCFAYWAFTFLLPLVKFLAALQKGDMKMMAQLSKGWNVANRAAANVLHQSDELQEQVFWYRSILDAIPFPLSVTDMNMNWTFINRPVEQFLKVKRENVLGKQCENWNANICRTENCGIARLRKNQSQTMFNQLGSDFQVDTSYLTNSKGERVGHIEVVQDISRHTAVSNYQTAAVAQVRSYLQSIASGVLGFEIAALPEANQYTKEVRENFVQILEHLEQARRMLYQTIDLVNQNAQEVSTASGQLVSAASQASQATSQIAATMQQIARGSSEQNEAINKMVTIVDGVEKTVQAVSSGVDNQNTAVAQARKVSDMISSKGGITDRVGLSAQKVQDMGERSKKIGLIIETIEDIAGQTNLLALNAAIEAARAGEHGKGFSVVADEVRKLAERSSAATKEISLLIKGIQTSVDEAVQMSNATAGDMQSAAANLDEAIRSVARVVEENAGAAGRLSTSSSQVMGSIENVASISEENGAAVEEVSASAEEMNAQVEEVTASANSLADSAVALQQAVARFKLEGQSTWNGLADAPARAAVSASSAGGNGHNGNGHNGNGKNGHGPRKA